MRSLALLLTALLLSSALPMAAAAPAPGAEHAFAVNSNSELVALATLMGWPGEGTADDPIIASSINFTTQYSQSAIFLGNTTLHFQISECVFDGQQAGAMLSRTANVTFANCTFKDCYLGIGADSARETIVNGSEFACEIGIAMVDGRGIRLQQSTLSVQPDYFGDHLFGLSLRNCTEAVVESCAFANGTNSLNECRNITFHSSTFQACDAGVDIIQSDIVRISASTMNDGLDGLVLGNESTNVQVIGSSFNNCSMRFEAADSGTYESLEVLTTSVGGRPFYLLRNANGGTYTTNAQQALLFNVTSAVLQNLVQAGSNGITLAYCDRVVVRNCTASDIKNSGVCMIHCSGCIVRGSTFIGGLSGVMLFDQGVSNRVETSLFTGCREGVMVHSLQELAEVSGSQFEECRLGISLEGQEAYASDNVLVDCTLGGIWAGQGYGIIVISNKVTGGGYGLRLAHLNNSIVQQNQIDGCSVGVILDSGNFQMYLSENLIANCTSHAVRIYLDGQEVFINHNRFIGNNGAGTSYSSDHVQAYDPFGVGTWNYTWGNYWSDWTANATSIGAYNISANAKDYHPYPMLRCGAPGSLDGKFNGDNLTVNWAAPAYPGFDPPSSYAIYRGDSAGNMTRIATVSGSVTSYVDHGLGSGTYYYQVSAISQFGESDRSGTLEAKKGSADSSSLILLLVVLAAIAVIAVAVFFLRRKK